MKFLHLSDLHLGKRVHGFSMLEDQAYILQQIIDCIAAEQPDGVLICGDIYDKAVPSAEAVALCDDFFYHLAQLKVPVFVISGNHDSPERLAFGSRLMDGSGVHFSPVYVGGVQPFVLTDKWGEVGIYMLPFVKPAHVRRYFPEAEIDSYTDALSVAVGAMQVDTSRRNVLLTHQFVTGAATSDSEELSVGGTDNVDGSVFDPFDYVALGHIHRPQNMGSPRLRYCGSPLKYSFSEAGHQKSVTVVELGAKGDLQVRTVLTGMVLTGCGQSQQAGETTQGSSEATETTESTSAESTAASGETVELEFLFGDPNRTEIFSRIICILR